MKRDTIRQGIWDRITWNWADSVHIGLVATLAANTLGDGLLIM
jgi:hypothetical protein